MLVASIKEACRKILGEEGESALTVAHVIETAGIEIGSLYQYFPNLDAILGEIRREEVIAHLEEQLLVMRHMDGMSFEAFLEHTIHSVFRFHSKLLHFDRRFYTKYPGHFRLTEYFNELCGDSSASQKSYRKFLGDRALPDGMNIERLFFMIDTCIDSMVERAVISHPEYLDDPLYVRQVFHMCIALLKHD